MMEVRAPSVIHRRSLTLFSLALGAAATLHAAPVTITLSGEALSFNETTEVPRGLFGVHATPLNDERVADWGIELDRIITRTPNGKNTVIAGLKTETGKDGKPRTSGHPAALTTVVECLWDRFQPAVRITRKDWKEFLTQLGTDYGTHALTTGQTHWIEFWNEPYLNWATLPGVNYHEAFYETGNIAPGQPMRLRTTGEEIPHLVWDRQRFFALQKANRFPDYFASSFIPPDGQPGDTVQLRQGRGSLTLHDDAEATLIGPRILSRQWIGRDTTQKFYWSGQVNLRFYLDMVVPFAEALKTANPDVRFAAGWGFNFFNENWACWENLIRPTIDAAHPWIDALHEHHYGGDTRLVAASYEVAHAYALAKYNKRLAFWNTEAGGHLDPEQPGNARPANEGDPVTRARAAMTYFLRDVVHLLAFTPDKALTRAAHEADRNGGDEFAFKLLKSFRGTLLHTASSSPRIWNAAALQGDRITLVLFNDETTPAEPRLELTPPKGTRLASLLRREVVAGTAAAPLELRETPIPLSDGLPATPLAPVPGKSAVVFVAALDSAPASPAQVRRLQFTPASPDVLLRATADSPAQLTIRIPAEAPRPRSAQLRLVLSSHPDSTTITLNGTTLQLRPGTSWIVDHPIDPRLLRTENELRITPPGGQNLLVATASILTDSVP